MPVDRLLPSSEARELIALVREISDGELAPRADTAEAAGEFPRDLVRLLGRSGLLCLPYEEGGDQPYEVYLQVIEEEGQIREGCRIGAVLFVVGVRPPTRGGAKGKEPRS